MLAGASSTRPRPTPAPRSVGSPLARDRRRESRRRHRETTETTPAFDPTPGTRKIRSSRASLPVGGRNGRGGSRAVAARLLPHPRYLLRGGLSRQPVGASSTLETALRGLRRTTYVAVDHHRGLLVCVLRLVCVDDEVALHHASVVRPCKDRASDGATRRRRSAAELQLGHPHLARALLGVLDHRDDRRRGESLTAGVDRGAGGPLRSEVPVADSERGAPLAAETLQSPALRGFRRL